MRKFLVLFKKELRELVTVHVVAPMVVTLVVLNIVGKIVSIERNKSAKGQKVAVMDLDRSDPSRFAVGSLAKSGFSAVELPGQPLDQALAAAEAGKAGALIVVPAGFGKGIVSLAQQKIEVYTLMRSLSLASTLRSMDVTRVAAAINEKTSARLIEAGVREGSPEFMRRPVSATDYVSLNGRRAKISLGHVIGFIQSQTALIPVVMLMVIMMSAQMVATAVVNEKENKTLETLLSLPINRNSIIFAKLSAAALVAFAFAGVFLIGFSFYMKDVVGDMTSGTSGNPIDIASALVQLGLVMSLSGYALLWTSLFFGILCALAIAMILGLLADDVKGAQVAIMPILVFVMIPYLLTVMMDIDAASPAVRWLVLAIPFSHPFLASPNILTGRVSYVVAGALYEAAVFFLFVTLATRLFSREAVITLRPWTVRKPARLP
ncbi:MAG: ABC transporter permease [Proteobacteria bacterium]|nr:ABC transporter permease [Pseudomonadota bacterium]